METFIFQAEKKLEDKQKDLQHCKHLFEETVEQYNFVLSKSSDSKTPGQFFDKWCSFTADFKDIWSEEISFIKESMYECKTLSLFFLLNTFLNF
jgi:hypothetical protein